MTTETVANLFAASVLAGLVGAAVLFALPASRQRLLAAAPILAALVAISATLGSLYFSEVAEFIPCELCWYQRIAMYPLAVVLPLGILRRDHGVMRYGLALSVIGLLVAANHVRLQWFPEQSNSCAIEAPCTAKWVEAFGIFTIPQLAGLSFLLIALLSAAHMFAPSMRSPNEHDDAQPADATNALVP